jgi:polyadenylation factor subunit 2
MSDLPVLLPANVLPKPPSAARLHWEPQKFLSEPQPPPQDDGKLMEQDLANARQTIDGKLIKKTRPRRTVDYNGGVGRWALVLHISFLWLYGR